MSRENEQNRRSNPAKNAMSFSKVYQQFFQNEPDQASRLWEYKPQLEQQLQERWGTETLREFAEKRLGVPISLEGCETKEEDKIEQVIL